MRRPIAAIVVSYNTRSLTLECLAHLTSDIRGAGGKVIVVDNASTDGSVAAISASHPDISLIANTTNVGFGKANNQAIAAAPTGCDLLLINSDAFMCPNASGQLAAYLATHPHVGIVGPRLLNADGSLQPSAWPFPTPARCWVEALGLSALFRGSFELGDWRRWTYDRSGPVPWLIGACLLVRREVVEQVGGFDESFFLYGEETEWERRVRKAGWEIHFVAEAEVTHLGGASGLSAKERTRSLFFDGLDRYTKKHHGLTGVVATRAAMVVGGVLRMPLFVILAVIKPNARKFTERLKELRWMIRRQLTDWHCLKANWTR